MQSNYNLSRFIDAQNPIYDIVLKELKQGSKQTHWMWFVFPQLAGLGRSETARYYALANKDEAKAYLENEVLKARLTECTEAVISCGVRNPVRIFGGVDAMKFQSCLTLFAWVEPENPLFRQALERFYQGVLDSKTEKLLYLK